MEGKHRKCTDMEGINNNKRLNSTMATKTSNLPSSNLPVDRMHRLREAVDKWGVVDMAVSAVGVGSARFRLRLRNRQAHINTLDELGSPSMVMDWMMIALDRVG
jgi:hypothetical protein